jgi:hypothetical protein
MKAKVGRDRFLGRLGQLGSVDGHSIDRRVELRKVQLLVVFEQLARSPGLDGLARYIDIEAIRKPLSRNEGSAVQSVLDQTFLSQVAQGFSNRPAAGPEQLHQLGLAQWSTGRDAAVDDRLSDDPPHGLGGR